MGQKKADSIPTAQGETIGQDPQEGFRDMLLEKLPTRIVAYNT